VLTPAAPTAVFGYRLPAGATQGPDRWYTVRLNYRITFEPDTGPGFAWVMADTNKRTAAQVEYTLRRSPQGLRVRETSVDIVNGQLEKVFRGGTSRVRFRNYLQTAGVRAGENELRLRLEQSEGARVRRVEVSGDSGVFRSELSPYPLRIEPRLAADDVHPDAPFQLVAGLSNRTGESLRNVEVRPAFDPRSLELLSPPVRRYAALVEPVEAIFTFRPLRVGRHRIDLLGSSSRNQPSAALAVTVTPEPSSRALRIAVWGVALLPLALLGGWLLRSRLRER
jgi:hypothetical protein